MTTTTLDHTVETQEQQDFVDTIILAVKDLPPMPQVVFKIQEALLDPNSNAKQIADLIETDQAIATKVLKMANSSYYGMSSKVTSVQHAAVILGNKTLDELTTIAGFSSLLGKKLPGYRYDSDELWKHSLAVALIAERIAEKIIPEYVNEALTAGLIHDVGKLILDPYVEENSEIFSELMEEGDQTFLSAEKQILGLDHAETASEVCRIWNFPELLTLSIKYHHCPSRSNGNIMAFIVHLADYIAVLSGSGYDIDDILYTLEGGTEEFLDIHQDDVLSVAPAIIDSIHRIEENLAL
jgi:putative nucleotidyltransferase with HDIG domain